MTYKPSIPDATQATSLGVAAGGSVSGIGPSGPCVWRSWLPTITSQPPSGAGHERPWPGTSMGARQGPSADTGVMAQASERSVMTRTIVVRSFSKGFTFPRAHALRRRSKFARRQPKGCQSLHAKAQRSTVALEVVRGRAQRVEDPFQVL